MVDVRLPNGFVNIDAVVDEEEKNPASRDAIATGRRSVAEHYYADGPKSLSWYRLTRGWSQKELARRLGSSQSYVARLGAGDIDPQVSTLQRLAAVFEVPAAELLEAAIRAASPTAAAPHSR